MAPHPVARVPLIESDLSDLAWTEMARRSQPSRQLPHGTETCTLEISHGTSQRLTENSGESIRTACHQFDMVKCNFSSQPVEQIKHVEILIMLRRNNFPPVQSQTVQQPAASTLKNLIYPAIRLRLTGKCMDAENPCS